MAENSKPTNRTRTKRKGATVLLGVGLVLATFMSLLSVATPKAEAGPSGWMVAFNTRVDDGRTTHSWGRQWMSNYGCGLKDCAKTGWMYYQGGRLSGPWADRARVKGETGFGGVNLSVAVAAGSGGDIGIEIGFSDLGSSCGDEGWWNSPVNDPFVRVDHGAGWVCEASTWGWISNADLTVRSGTRSGNLWRTVNASNTWSIGGF